MFIAFLVLGVASFLAILYNNSRNKAVEGYTIQYKEDPWLAKLVFFSLCVFLIFFSGLRTTMNDTPTYITNFNKIPNSFSQMSADDYLIGRNPLFVVYQIFIKRYISTNASVFLLITSFIVNVSFLRFLRKYSLDFSLVIYLYITFLVYSFTMGATKQALATAMALWAIPAIVEKKWIRAILLVTIPVFIHPYVLIFAVAFFVSKGIWDKKTFLIIVIALASGAGFSLIVENLISITSSFGDQYTNEMFAEGGINLLRLAVFLVAPVLSFVYRERIREDNNPVIIISVNLCLISTSIMYIASFGGANLFGRMANYFSIFHCIVIPYVIIKCMKDSKYRTLVLFFCIVGFIGYYYMYYNKYVPVYGNDFFNHVSLWDVIANWR